MERTISVSRSGLKSQRRSIRGIPFNGVKSVTFVFWQSSIVRGIPFRGDRPETNVLPQLNCVSFNSLIGDRSDTCVPQIAKTVNGDSCSGDKSDTRVPPQLRFARGIPLMGDRSDTGVFSMVIVVRGIPLMGDKSASLPFRGEEEHPRFFNPVKARTGEMSLTYSTENDNSTTSSFLIECRMVPSKLGFSSLSLAATASNFFSTGRPATCMSHFLRAGVLSVAIGFFLPARPRPLSRTRQPICR